MEAAGFGGGAFGSGGGFFEDGKEDWIDGDPAFLIFFAGDFGPDVEEGVGEIKIAPGDANAFGRADAKPSGDEEEGEVLWVL